MTLPDIERILTRVYTYSVKQKVKAFYIDAQAINRLDEFHDLCETLRAIVDILKDIFHKGKKASFSSQRLRKLVNFKNVVKSADGDEEMKSQTSDNDEDEEEGIFPNYIPILDEFANMIEWKSFGGKRIPEPKRGIDEEFDGFNEAVNKIKEQMQDYAKDVEKDIGSKVVLF